MKMTYTREEVINLISSYAEENGGFTSKEDIQNFNEWMDSNNLSNLSLTEFFERDNVVNLLDPNVEITEQSHLIVLESFYNEYPECEIIVQNHESNIRVDAWAGENNIDQVNFQLK